ncbi:hypothetical protein EDB19DRAFT_1936715 [Suillus lakei]|nr:hypothetical protein EDB19DRAFT_1936715 [Suillus lakei]
MEEGEEQATVALVVPKVGAVLDASPTLDEMRRQVGVANGNLLQVRTYNKDYQTPWIWLLGYDENHNRSPLTPSQIFQDVSADHALKPRPSQGLESVLNRNLPRHQQLL